MTHFWLLYLKSVLAGIVIACPVGAVALLIVKETLNNKRRQPLLTALGATLADTFWGGITSLGLGALSDFVVCWQHYFLLGGGSALVIIGTWLFFREPWSQSVKQPLKPWLAFSVGFALTFFNPATVLGFLSVFSALSLPLFSDYLQALWITCGIFSGATVWWLSLSGCVMLLKRRFGVKELRFIHYGTALLLISLGMISLAQGARHITTNFFNS